MDIVGFEATVFVKEGEDLALWREAMQSLVPDELRERKLLVETKAAGFNEKTITILAIRTAKKREVKLCTELLWKLLGARQLRMLDNELETRLDRELALFVRIDKGAWLDRRSAKVVEHGDCVHFRISVATYPKSRGAAIAGVREILEGKTKSI